MANTCSCSFVGKLSRLAGFCHQQTGLSRTSSKRATVSQVANAAHIRCCACIKPYLSGRSLLAGDRAFRLTLLKSCLRDLRLLGTGAGMFEQLQTNETQLTIVWLKDTSSRTTRTDGLSTAKMFCAAPCSIAGRGGGGSVRADSFNPPAPRPHKPQVWSSALRRFLSAAFFGLSFGVLLCLGFRLGSRRVLARHWALPRLFVDLLSKGLCFCFFKTRFGQVWWPCTPSHQVWSSGVGTMDT